MPTAYGIPNCLAWYRADKDLYTDAGVTPAQPGQSIQQWNDQSGSNNHLTQTTANHRPILNQFQSQLSADGPQPLAQYGYATQLYQEIRRPSVMFDGDLLCLNIPSTLALTSAGCTVLMCTRGSSYSPIAFGTNGATAFNYGWIAPQQMALRSTTLHPFPNSAFLPALNPIVHGFRCSAAAGQSRLYISMNQTSDITSNLFTTNTTGGTIGQTPNANDLSFGNFSFLGEIFELLIFSVPLTDTQIQTLLQNLHASNQLPQDANTQQIIFIGDSTTAGGSDTVPFTQSYPWILCQQFGPSLKPLVIAGAGQGIADQQTAVTNSVLNLDVTPFRSNIAVICAGGDEILTGQTVNQILTALAAMCAGLKSAGFKVIIATLTPRDSTTGYTAGNVTTLNTLNTTLRAAYTTFADALADWAADPRLSDCTNPLYFADSQNTTPTGDGVKASIVKAALNPLFESTPTTTLAYASFYTPGQPFTGNYGNFLRS